MRKPTRVELKLRRRRIIFRFILLLTTLVLVVLFALKTNFFNIDHIEVSGNKKLSKEEIIISSLINKGENIFKIKTLLGRDNINKTPYIKSSTIKRKFPRRVDIEVEERNEIIQVKLLGTYLLIDKEGYILEQIENKREDLPLIIGLEVNNIRPGDNLFSRIKFEKAVEFINEIYECGILKNTTEISMELFDDINIILNDGITVAFGTLDNVKYRLSLLDEVLKDISKNGTNCKSIIMNKGENPILVIGN